MKRFLFLCLLASVFGCFSASAYDFYVDGIYYNQTGTNTVGVSYNKVYFGVERLYNYKGKVVIPEKITVDDVEYRVTSITNEAFSGCEELTAISIPQSITSIGDEAFSHCRGLESVALPSSITKIGNAAFDYCSSLTSITIPASIDTISRDLFCGCTSLESVEIPNTVRYIDKRAFYGCTSLKSVFVPDGVEEVEWQAFDDSTKLYVNKGTLALLALWRNNFIPYQRNTNNRLLPPVASLYSVTQTTVTVKLENLDNSFSYGYASWSEAENRYKIHKLSGDKFTSRGYMPNESTTVPVYGTPVGQDGPYVVFTSVGAKTAPISPEITLDTVTATSFTTKGTYIAGDAKVIKQAIVFNDSAYAGNTIKINGLMPNTKYTVAYELTYKSRGEVLLRAYKTFYTDSIRITTLQPKVVSEGNVIVQAQINVDEDEQDVGFEWRRTDWDDTFASSTAIGYVYDGVMEGYIRNMNANRLWKYRAYYQSSSGRQYYSDWVGIDPSNTSYFEPTVHTYAQVGVNANTAHLKGYAQRGTDRIEAQGFIYWKSGVVAATEIPSSSITVAATEIPSDAITVAATGTLMETTLLALDFNSQYTYVAFVRTSEGETFYGAEQTFYIGEDPDGIVSTDIAPTTSAVPVAIYDLRGHRLPDLQKGINLVRYSDGSAKKVLVK